MHELSPIFKADQADATVHPIALHEILTLCKDFKNPSCPKCAHKLYEHSVTGCPIVVEADPTCTNGFYKQNTKKCDCDLGKDDIVYNLVKKAQENFSHEELEKTRKQESKDYNDRMESQNHRISPEAPADGSYGSIGWHIPFYDCCPSHNNTFGGPARSTSGSPPESYGHGSYGEGV